MADQKKKTVMPVTVSVLVTATVEDGKMTWHVEDADMRAAIKAEIKRRMSVIHGLGELVKERSK